MAERPEQQQMKTSFLFIQLWAPPRALPALSPAAAAWTAAPGGLEEGHIFPSPRTGFLAGHDLRHTQGLAVPPSLLQKEGRGTVKLAAFSCSALKEETEGEEKHQDLEVRRGGVGTSPRRRRSLAPASGTLGRQQPLSCRLPRPAAVMSDGSNNPSTGWKHWPVMTGPQDLWSVDPQSCNALGCSVPQATLTHAADRSEEVKRGAAIYQVLPKSCEEGTGPTVRARRARLCRYCPPVQTSTRCLAPPAALPYKAWLAYAAGGTVLDDIFFQQKAVSSTLKICFRVAAFLGYLSQMSWRTGCSFYVSTCCLALHSNVTETASFLKPHEPTSASFNLCFCSFFASPSLHRIEESQGLFVD
uniref:Uncharacterized protein n=1 Tax=Equus asinus TaxID=9793 RepID=A0A9L0JVD7_EQUAS